MVLAGDFFALRPVSRRGGLLASGKTLPIPASAAAARLTANAAARLVPTEEQCVAADALVDALSDAGPEPWERLNPALTRMHATPTRGRWTNSPRHSRPPPRSARPELLPPSMDHLSRRRRRRRATRRTRWRPRRRRRRPRRSHRRAGIEDGRGAGSETPRRGSRVTTAGRCGREREGRGSRGAGGESRGGGEGKYGGGGTSGGGGPCASRLPPSQPPPSTPSSEGDNLRRQGGDDRPWRWTRYEWTRSPRTTAKSNAATTPRRRSLRRWKTTGSSTTWNESRRRRSWRWWRRRQPPRRRRPTTIRKRVNT